MAQARSGRRPALSAVDQVLPASFRDPVEQVAVVVVDVAELPDASLLCSPGAHRRFDRREAGRDRHGDHDESSIGGHLDEPAKLVDRRYQRVYADVGGTRFGIQV